MTTLTSALNYGALITLSCCNAVLQIAAAPSCAEETPGSTWPSCTATGPSADDDRVRKLFQPDRNLGAAPAGDRDCLHDGCKTVR